MVAMVCTTTDLADGPRTTISVQENHDQLQWNNKFWDENSLWPASNIKLQVSWSFTDGSDNSNYARNVDGITYQETWPITTNTATVTSNSFPGPTWTLGVSHEYSADFNNPSKCWGTNVFNQQYTTHT